MEKRDIDLYLTTNAKYFEPTAVPILREKLEKADKDALITLQSCELKDPTTMLLVSIFLGCLGVDRFMLGDVGMGILKLCTLGLCYVLWIIDIVTIQKKVKEKNLATVSMVL